MPKYMYPLSSILSCYVTFAISLLCLVSVWIFFKLTGISNGHALHLNGYAVLFFVPMFILLVFCTGVGMILSVLSVYFRDVEYIWDVLCHLLFYMVPIIYPLHRITSDWIVVLIKINPLYSMIELFRQCILYGQMMTWNLLLYASVVSLVTLAIGLFVFNKCSDKLIFHL